MPTNNKGKRSKGDGGGHVQEVRATTVVRVMCLVVGALGIVVVAFFEVVLVVVVVLSFCLRNHFTQDDGYVRHRNFACL